MCKSPFLYPLEYSRIRSFDHARSRPFGSRGTLASKVPHSRARARSGRQRRHSWHFAISEEHYSSFTMRCLLTIALAFMLMNVSHGVVASEGDRLCEPEEMSQYNEAREKYEHVLASCVKTSKERGYIGNESNDVEPRQCAIRECKTYIADITGATPNCVDDQGVNIKTVIQGKYDECMKIYKESRPSSSSAAFCQTTVSIFLFMLSAVAILL